MHNRCECPKEDAWCHTSIVVTFSPQASPLGTTYMYFLDILVAVSLPVPSSLPITAGMMLADPLWFGNGLPMSDRVTQFRLAAAGTSAHPEAFQVKGPFSSGDLPPASWSTRLNRARTASTQSRPVTPGLEWHPPCSPYWLTGKPPLALTGHIRSHKVLG